MLQFILTFLRWYDPDQVQGSETLTVSLSADFSAPLVQLLYSINTQYTNAN